MIKIENEKLLYLIDLMIKIERYEDSIYYIEEYLKKYNFIDLKILKNINFSFKYYGFFSKILEIINIK